MQGAVMLKAGQTLNDLLDDRFSGIIEFLKNSVEINQEGVVATTKELEKEREIKRDLLALEIRIHELRLSLTQADSQGNRRGPDLGRAADFPTLGPVDVVNELFKRELDVIGLQHTARNNLDRENRLKRQRDAEKEFEHRMMLLDAFGFGLQSLGDLVGKSTQEGKAIAAAGALIDTYAAITKTMAVYGGTPLGWSQSIAIGLAGFANVKRIYDVRVPNQSGGSGAVPTVDAPETQPPDFNIVGGSGINQLREAISGQLNRPVKVFVTSKDVATGAELERNIIEGAIVG
jgi:hypothetical protein